ncbi:hypothetical protein [Legionella sainthelensi]|uniref:hypothetical protein n=1 Tax=Legionella sainthelensi TaxID=28087 RepID=UPI0015F2E54A|nr:hypothetical protein [Legionella sainthelensi]
MNNLIDEAYRDCYFEIMKNNSVSTFIKSHLSELDIQIKKIKENLSISREIIEVCCFKLGILCDLARNTFQNNIYLSEDEINNWLAIPLAETHLFKKCVQRVGSSGEYQNFANTNLTLPIFSKNGSLGFNTILYTELNGYFPIGFSASPYPVHGGLYENQSFNSSQHDYGHAYQRVLDLKEKSPHIFEQYKQLYNKLIEQKNLNQIDDLSFKKDLLFLFMLVHELAYSPDKDQPVVELIKERTNLPCEMNDDFLIELEKNGEDSYLTEFLVIETIDFVIPLKALGYEIEYSENKKWKSAPSLRKALLDILAGFNERHPEIKIEPQQYIKPQF